MSAVKLQRRHFKRGDTIIEVMFAFAIFSMIAIISVSMMNIGIAASERSLELVTARNELNAQADALRFVHSSYISEATLPPCSGDGAASPGEKCQQYLDLWNMIKNNSITTATFNDDPAAHIEYPLMNCSDVYANHNDKLIKNKAFVLNTRRLNSSPSTSYIAASTSDIFREAPLNARIIYTNSALSNGDSSQQLYSSTLTDYTTIKYVEGIWVIAVRGPSNGGASSKPQYYDFYIETCWNGSGSTAPTSLDTVIRLYNPEGI